MKIGITTSETSYSNYPKWIVGNDAIEIVELSFEKYNLNSLTDCDGLVLSGGVDIMPENIDYANAPKEFYPIRDQFEKEVLELALKEKMPILGICRGLQLINMYFGGDLTLDLAEKNISHKKGELDKIHTIAVDKNSQFFQIVGQNKGEVNSAHHQAISQLAKGLNIACISADGVIEAIELNELNDQFLLAVQWHPERMSDQNSSFTKNIRSAFLEAASNYRIQNINA
jgi:putative glutamine amidotransferase